MEGLHEYEQLPSLLEGALSPSSVLNSLKSYEEALMNALKAMNLAAPASACAQILSEPAKEWIRGEIARELERLAKSPYEVKVEFEPGWGYVYHITVDASAREALEMNLRLQEEFRGIPIVVEWTGETDVAEEELVDRLVEVLTRGGIKARAPPGFSAVEAVREGRRG
jgi:hypothetical protein